MHKTLYSLYINSQSLASQKIAFAVQDSEEDWTKMERPEGALFGTFVVIFQYMNSVFEKWVYLWLRWWWCCQSETCSSGSDPLLLKSRFRLNHWWSWKVPPTHWEPPILPLLRSPIKRGHNGLHLLPAPAHLPFFHQNNFTLLQSSCCLSPVMSEYTFHPGNSNCWKLCDDADGDNADDDDDADGDDNA